MSMSQSREIQYFMKQILSDITACHERISYLKLEFNRPRSDSVMSNVSIDMMSACHNDQINRYEEILSSLNAQIKILESESNIDPNLMPKGL